MAWITPKTNWVEDDYINASDINRIVGNIAYLKELASHLFAGTFSYTAVEEKNVLYDFYADEINAIETNLENMNNYTLQYYIGETATYSPNGAWVNATELNRIESGTLRLYNEMTVRHNNLDRLSFTLGGERKFKI